MSFKIEKSFSVNVLAVSIAAIGLATPTVTWSQEASDEVKRLIHPHSEVEVGIGHVSSDSFKFGDYTGVENSGAYGIANISVIRRNENDASYFELVGRNLGLSSRSLRITGGEQGNYGLWFEYDELPKLISDSYQTPFTNPGETNLTLPAGWVRGATTAAMTNLNASMRPFKVETMRKSLGLGLTKLLPAGWEVSVDFKREKKEGNRLIGATFGTGGGNPRAAILPEPVDYTTDQFEAVARYNTEKMELQFAYYGSFFKNANDSLIWANPYSGTVWGGVATAFPSGRIGVPPDNQFHQLNASGGYSYSKDTRVTGNLSFGRMTQNDAFLPFSITTTLLNGAAMPRSSLDGRVNTTHADLKLTSKLMPKLNFILAYRYDDRDNKTPQAKYQYLGGDSQTQTAAGAGKLRTNLPGSSTKQQIDAEVDYHLGTHTKLKAGYGFDWVKKTFEAIDWEREHTVKAGVSHRFNDMASGGVSYAFSDRWTSTYNAAGPYLASYDSTAWNADPTLRWDNVPTQKKFFLAPRKRDKLRAHVNLAPTEKIDLQLGIDYKSDNYHSSEYGLRDASGWAFNFDGNWVVTEALHGHMFASLENYATNQRSSALGAVQNNYLNPNFAWTADIEDRTVTSGIGFRYKPGGQFEFGGDITHSRSKGKIDMWTGTAVAATSQVTVGMPDLTTRMTRLDLFGKYEIKKDVTLQLKYVYERFNSTDWAYDQVLANSMGNVIGTNQTSPDYKVQAVGASVSYRFW